MLLQTAFHSTPENMTSNERKDEPSLGFDGSRKNEKDNSTNSSFHLLLRYISPVKDLNPDGVCGSDSTTGRGFKFCKKYIKSKLMSISRLNIGLLYLLFINILISLQMRNSLSSVETKYNALLKEFQSIPSLNEALPFSCTANDNDSLRETLSELIQSRDDRLIHTITKQNTNHLFEKKEAQQRIISLSSENEKLQEEIQHVSSKSRELEMLLQLSDSKVADLLHQNNILSSTREEKNVQAFRDLENIFFNERDMLNEKNLALQNENVSLSGNIIQLQKEIDALQATNSKLVKKLKIIQKESDAFKSKCSLILDEIEKLVINKKWLQNRVTDISRNFQSTINKTYNEFAEFYQNL